MLLGASVANGATLPRLRFLNALPGTATARVEVVSATTGMRTGAGGESAYGELTPYAAVPGGSVRLDLVAPKAHASAPEQLAAGASYTVIATGSSGHAQLRLYRDGSAAAGAAKLRVIHAAPELGTPDIALDGRPIAQAVAFGSSTGYLTATPGSANLAVMSPHSNSRTIASGQVSLAAGTATTAVVIGTAGQPVRVVSAQDATVTPGGPPETGLGGLARGGGRQWLLILAAMATGGLLAGGLQAAARRRRDN
jgi:hypothetical protein